HPGRARGGVPALLLHRAAALIEQLLAGPGIRLEDEADAALAGEGRRPGVLRGSATARTVGARVELSVGRGRGNAIERRARPRHDRTRDAKRRRENERATHQ